MYINVYIFLSFLSFSFNNLHILIFLKKVNDIFFDIFLIKNQIIEIITFFENNE